MHVLVRGDTTQRLRLASGLVLFAFTATHFLNHALGLVSLEAMLTAQGWRMAVTRSLPVSLLLAAAILTHASLALYKLARRQTLRMPFWEAAQIITGVLIPYLLVQHVVYNRGANLIAGTDDTYRFDLANLWPGFAVDQFILLALVWTHAMIGLHYWLRLAPSYRKWQPLLIALAALIPALAAAGFAVAGRDVTASLAEPGARERLMAALGAPDSAAAARLEAIKGALQTTFYGLVALAVAFPLLASLRRAAAGRIGVSYLAGPALRAVPGPTLLEISRMHGVPHASMCGGRARCSTCRVHVLDGEADLPAPRGAEAETLASVGAAPGVRLACQIRPDHDIAVRRLISLSAKSGRTIAGIDEQGSERHLAVLFFDLRGFTALSERRLAYDVVFALNALFAEVGAAIERQGGRIDKFMGDGLMAVFGHDDDNIGAACRAALRACREIDRTLDDIGARHSELFGGPPACAMGLHAGSLVIGRIGMPERSDVTVIGAPVNAASRLESLAKERGCQLAVSRSVLRLAGVTLTGETFDTVAIRSVADPIDVALVSRARRMRGA